MKKVKNNVPENKGKRGQIFSLDALVAATIVLMIFVAVFLVNDTLYYALRASTAGIELKDAALSAADAIASSQGVPSNWTEFTGISTASVSTLGLARERGVMDPDKVSAFFLAVNTTTLNSNYTNARAILGLSRPGYNFSLSIYNSTNSRILNTNASAISASSNLTASIQRYVLYNGEMVRLNLRVWKDES